MLKRENIFAATLIALSFTLFRLSNFASPLVKNPDEADLLVASIRASKNLIPYSGYTTTSYGYLWPLTLGMLGRIGLTLDFRTLHIACGIISILILIILYNLLATKTSKLLSFSISIISAVVWANQGFYPTIGIAALSTEIMPLLLITAATYIYVRKPESLGVVLVLLGIAPWYKYQFLPLVLVIAATFIVTSGRREKQSVIYLWKWFFTPTALSILVFVVLGNFIVFLDEGLGTVVGHIVSIGFLERLLSTQRFYLTNIFFLLPALVLLPVAYHDWTNSLKGKFLSIHLVALLTLQITPFFQDHYAYVLFAGSIASIAFLPSVTKKDNIGLTRFIAVLFGYLAIVYPVTATVLGQPIRSKSSSSSFDLAIYPEKTLNFSLTKKSKALSEVCPPRSKVFVWGWTSEIYIIYRYVPVSRYIIAYSLLNYSDPARKKTLHDDLLRERPDCILDTTPASFFGQFPPSSKLTQQIPELEVYLKKNYVLDTALLTQADDQTEVWLYRKKNWIEE